MAKNWKSLFSVRPRFSWAALGDYGYLVRSPELGEITSMTQYIQAID